MSQKYGKWEDLGSIGEGGQGRIFRVKTADDPTERALKRLKNSKRLARFKDEVETMKRVVHPNLAPILDYELEGERPFLVMPFYPGGCLNDAKRLEFSAEQRMALFEQVLLGVGALHSNGVTHRDLKPENILLDAGNRAIVADFGLCHFDGKEPVTLTGEVVGPRHYTAPELEVGGPVDVKPTADVYSLGKLFYWLLTGSHLPRERFKEPAYQLAAKLDDPRVRQWDRFLDVTVTEDPGKRSADAQMLTDVFRAVRKDWEKTINVPNPTAEQRCVFCGVGSYRWFAPDTSKKDGGSNMNALYNRLGITLVGSMRIRAMVCDKCRNVQYFDVSDDRKDAGPNPWAPGK